MCLRALIIAIPTLLFAACSGPQENGSAGTSSSSAASNVAGKPAKPDVPHILDEKFYTNADGNAVPDFMETARGYDPTREECSLDSCGSGATGDNLDTKSYTLLMLDASGSMAARSGGSTRMEDAKAALQNYVADVPSSFALGFLVYGHKGNNTPGGKGESCAEGGAEILVPVGGIDKQTFATQVLSRFQPTGWTPIARALNLARTAFKDAKGPNHIIMVSDGLETCGGDPVGVARQLHNEGFHVVVDVVGFGSSSNDASQLRAIAQAGGGEYFDAKTRAQLDEYFNKQKEAYKKNSVDIACMQDTHLRFVDCNFKLYNSASEQFNAELDKITDRVTQQNQYNEITRLKFAANAAYMARVQMGDAFKAKLEKLRGQMQQVSGQMNRTYQQMR